MDNNVNIVIRPVRTEDWPGILEAHREAVMRKTSGHYTQEQKEAWIESMRSGMEERKQSVEKGENVVLVAEYNGRIAGFAAASPSRRQLFQLYVAPGEWVGVGKRLLSAIEEKMAFSGVVILDGRCTLNAVEFYRRRGYNIGEPNVRELACGVGLPGFIIRKQLKP